MRKRSDSLYEDPAKRKPPLSGIMGTKEIKPGHVLTDITGKKWKVGKPVGTGAFGDIYLASDKVTDAVKPDTPYIVKIESHNNGPLFVEINCYLRIAKAEMVNEWKRNRCLRSLGMPHYVASGSHTIADTKYRFLILPRYEQDLEKLFAANKNKFNLKTVITISLQIIDTLEYIHSRGYIHCDIKASNILLSAAKTRIMVHSSVFVYRGCNPVRSCREKKRIVVHTRNLRPKVPVSYENEYQVKTADQVYLLDFGLATKYLQSNGEHKHFSTDERKAHAGTIMFCSLDAHSGVQSRRSDLETLGYNMIYWLTSELPWDKNVDDPETVQKKKQNCFENLDEFLTACFGLYPQFVYDYFKYVQNLDFYQEPDYDYCKNLLKRALNEYGLVNDSCLDFTGSETWDNKQKRRKRMSENLNRTPKVKRLTNRIPFSPNIIIDRQSLRKRKAARKGKKAKINWDKILSDPEEILRQSNRISKTEEAPMRVRKNTDASDCSYTANTLANLDIWRLNPTDAMLEVYNKAMERNCNANGASPKHRGDHANFEIEDRYTPAMSVIAQRKKERELEDFERLIATASPKASTKSRLRKRKPVKTPRKAKSAPSLNKTRKKSKSPRLQRSYGLRG